jgi:hypothetical protein
LTARFWGTEAYLLKPIPRQIKAIVFTGLAQRRWNRGEK